MSGAPATGKSSIIKLLLNEPPPDNHHSTPVIKAPEVRKVEIAGLVAGGEPTGSSSTQCWDKVDYESLKAMVTRTMKGGIKSKTSVSEGDVDNSLQGDESGDDDTDDDDIGHENAVLTTPTKESPEVTSLPTPRSQAREEVAQLLPTVSKSDELYNTLDLCYRFWRSGCIPRYCSCSATL